MDEKEAIAASRKGDVDSFNLLVAAYERQVYNLALSMLGNTHDAEDATQDAFLSAYRTDHFTGWDDSEGVYYYGFAPPTASVRTIMGLSPVS